MTRTKSRYLALLVVLLSPMAANADPIPSVTPCPFFFSGNCLDASIANLAVNGINYDVEIVEGIFSDLFPDQAALESSTFWNDASGAEAAAQAIADLLTIFSIEGIITPTSPASIFGGLVILYDVTGTTQSLWLATSTDFFGASGDWETADGAFSTDASAPYAFFRPVSVPEPGTLALLGIGLLGMGAARRRKKA